MKHIYKKTILFLALLFTGLVFAATPTITDEQGIIYTISGDGTVTVTGHTSGDSYEGSINIPETVTSGENTYTVTAIGDSAFYDYDKMTDLTIPNTVTTIGKQCLCGSGITSLIIPDSVTTIESEGLSYTQIKFLTLPSTVSTIGDKAFSNSGIKLFYTGDATGSPWGAAAFGSVKDGEFVYCDDAKTELAFYMGSDASVEIPYGVLSIGQYAFSENENLVSVKIPSTVTSIGKSSFYSCDNLTSVTLNEGLNSIGNYAFAYCKNLSVLEVPYSVTEIGSSAFANVPKVIYGGTATGSPWGATEFIAGIEDGDFVFADSTKKRLNQYIGSGTEVVIPEGVTTIGKNCFSVSVDNAKAITSLTIPDSVTTIEDYAFYWCYGLKYLLIPSSVTSIGQKAFGDGDKTTVIYAGSATGSPWGAEEVICGIVDGDYVYSDQDKSSLLRYLGSDQTVTIPQSVTSLADNAFSDNTDISQVYCYANPENLTLSVNQFSNTSVTIHVYAEYLADYKEKFSASNISYVALASKLTAKKDPYSKGNFYTSFFDSKHTYTADTSTEVYYVSKMSDGSLTLVKVEDNVIKAGEGVILKSSSDIINLSISDSTTDYDSLLTGSESETSVENALVLSLGENGVRFYKYSGEVSANKAWISGDESGSE